MGSTAKKTETRTWADIMATFDRVAVLSEKNEKKLDRLEVTVDRTAATVDKLCATVDRTSAIVDRTSANVDKTSEDVRKMIGEVKGIGKSNGMVSEDYFFESLSQTKTLGGVHYDIVKRNMASAIKLEDGKTLDDEYDTVMINDTVVCVVEVKYKVKAQDVKKLAKIRVRNFKILFPMYADYKIYLAIGGLTFERGAVDAAKELGMGVLRVKSGALEVYDKDLKAY